jgi:hypothetical protein
VFVQKLNRGKVPGEFLKARAGGYLADFPSGKWEDRFRQARTRLLAVRETLATRDDSAS